MTIRARHRLRFAVIAAAAAGCALGGALPAAAHPLGNFTVNHYDGLILHPDRIDDHAVVDTAEIATLQRRGDVDTDRDGTASTTESATYARTQCADLAATLRAAVDGRTLQWHVTAAAFTYLPGNAGLDTGRLTCDLTAPADLGGGVRVDFTDDFQSERIGWHEITATTGPGLHLDNPPVPAKSISDELRRYPDDMLASPPDQRHVLLHVAPGAAAQPPAAGPGLPTSGFAATAISRVDAVFNDLVGTRHLTLTAGLLAVLLSLVLGASHAAMPGHGKTVMAAYLAGRRGTTRDAVTVGATVTLTHTAGVLLLGLLLTASASLAGESLLAWLGIASGLLIAAVGTGLLIGTARGRTLDLGHTHGHRHKHGHSHSHSHSHGHGHTHGTDSHEHSGEGHHSHQHHTHDHHTHDSHDESAHAPLTAHAHHHHGEPSEHHRPVDTAPMAIPAPAGPEAPAEAAVLANNSTATMTVPASADLRKRPQDHTHLHANHPGNERHAPSGAGRRGRRVSLVGIGVAGGLVPSPSALIVLLGAIGLGRTWFGVLLVIGYGLGMAATLTAAGLLLVRLRDRLDHHRLANWRSRLAGWSRISPYLTATLVLCVGLALALRAAGPLV
ncbi:hypothetical protein GCM10023205_68330 [Yinghuangia aomiensis]|uniref:ABC-type nickel/cobalt efflux system, permease component RcnA n=1 Tax=Yinghuangia aomiensis TaxID=676205 RepID=A0ABP9I5K7_9ACTN